MSCNAADAQYGGEAFPASSCELPLTGSEPIWLVVIALAFLLIGVGLYLAVRHLP